MTCGKAADEQGWTHGEMERDAGVLATERLSPERGHGAQQHVRACAGGQLLKRVSVLPGRWLDAYVTYFCFFCVFFVVFFTTGDFMHLARKLWENSPQPLL